jgi:hypothetical protein
MLPWVKAGVVLLLGTILGTYLRLQPPELTSWAWQWTSTTPSSADLIVELFNVDILLIIYSANSTQAADLRAFHDLRFRQFPLLDPAQPDVRIWTSDDDPARNLTFAYYYLRGNDSLSEPKRRTPSHYDPETRVITLPIPGTYRSLPWRTRALLLNQSTDFFPPQFAKPTYDLLFKIDDDSFLCYNVTFSRFSSEISFPKLPNKGPAARTLWGGGGVVASVVTDPTDRWFDPYRLAEIGWKPGDPEPNYPDEGYFTGFATMWGAEIIERFEENADKLHIYALEDAMLSVWIHEKLKWKEGKDFWTYYTSSENDGCVCSRPRKREQETMIYHGCHERQEHEACLKSIRKYC